MKEFDFYKEREQKREFLKPELPIDKQLEGSLGKNKWKFENPLSALRNSESSSDQYFIEKLKQYNGESSSDVSLDFLQEAKEKEEKEMLDNLKVENIFLRCFNDDREEAVSSLEVLIPINPELYIQLLEKSLNDDNWRVRKKAVSSLETLASINSELYIQLLEKSLNDGNEDVREEAVSSLETLVSINPELYIQLLEKSLNDSNKDVREEAVSSLATLAPINPELFIQLLEKSFNDRDGEVREKAVSYLETFISTNPELYAQLFEKSLNNDYENVYEKAVSSLEALAPTNQELYIQLLEKSLNDDNCCVREKAIPFLETLAPTNPELYIQLLEKSLNDYNCYVREKAIPFLGTLAPTNPELYIQLLEKSLNDGDWRVRGEAASSLETLAPINPELYAQLLEKSFDNSSGYVRGEAVSSLAALAPINPELYAQLLEKSFDDSDWHVRYKAVSSLAALAPINPELYAQLLEKSFDDSDGDVREKAVSFLEVLAPINPELYARLFEKSLNNSNKDVREKMVSSLAVLAPINPELYAQLLEKTLNDNNKDVRKKAVSSLEVLIPVNPVLYTQLFEKNLNHDNEDVRKEAVSSLETLASINPGLYTHFIEKCFNNKNNNVRNEAVSYLDALFLINPELYIQLLEKSLNDDNEDVRKKAVSSLEMLALINQKLYIQLLEKSLNDDNEDVRKKAVSYLETLALINPKLYAQLLEKSLNDSYGFIRKEVVSSLETLLAINPKLYAQLLEKSLNDEDYYVRNKAVSSLEVLAPINPELYAQLLEKSLNDDSWYVRKEVVSSLETLLPINPKLYAQLLEKSLNDDYEDVRNEAVSSLEVLIPINPELYTRLLKKSLNDDNEYVRKKAVSSLEVLAPTNPELYTQLFEESLNNDNWYIRKKAVSSLKVLAPINPELYVQLLKKSLNNGNRDVREGIVFSIKNYQFEANPLMEKINKIISEKTDNSNIIFTDNLLCEAIKEKKVPQTLEYLDVFNKVKEHLEEKNKSLDATKKIISVENFFSNHQFELSNLAKIFSPKEFGVFLTALSADTLLYTKSFLEIVKPVYNDAEISAVLKNYFHHNSLKQDEIEKIFETGAQFVQLRKKEQFIAVINSGGDIQESLDRMLLDNTAQEVGIDSSTLPVGSLNRWNAKYLTYLGSNNKIIKDRIRDGEENYENVQSLYKKIVEHGFIGDFKEFILELSSGDEVGEDIASHNKNVFAKFKDLGIDPKTWYDYVGTKDFLVSKEIKVDNTKHFQETLGGRAKVVIDLLTEIKSELTPRQYEPLMHILQGAKNKGLSDITNYEELKKQYQLLNERIIKIKEESFKDSREEYFGSLFEHLGHLEEAVELFKKENLNGTETKEQGFRVKLWDRDPARDLFQGNYTHCCIAVGVKDAPQEGGLYTHDPATVAQFLADAGMQVAEVYDQEKKDPIANTWLFVSKDSNGEPVLVLDNVEVNNKYKDVMVNSAIRDNLFAFAKDFAKECNIPKVGIGMVGTNDIEWQSLNQMVVAPVDKVGGYLKDYTSTGGPRAGRYYLEAYNSQILGEIYNEEENNRKLKIEKEQRTFSGLVTIINMDTATSESFDNTVAGIQSFAERRGMSVEEAQNNLENIENKAFADSGLAESAEEIIATLTSPKGIGFVFMEGNKIVGYLSSLSADKFTPLVNHSEYDNSDKALYIESIAGKVDPYQALQKLKEQAKEGGYEKIILHGINPRLNGALSRFGFEKKATIDNWAGNKADYMELSL